MDKIDAKLIRYNTKLAMIKSKVAEDQVNMKPEYLSQVSNLEKKRDEFMKKYGQLRICSEPGWEDVKGEAKTAWNELEKAFDKADVFIVKKIIRDNSNKYRRKSRYLKLCDDKR